MTPPVEDGGPEGAPPPDASTEDTFVPVRHECTGLPRPPNPSSIELTHVYKALGLSRPMGLFQAPGDPSKWYEVEQDGSIYSFPTNDPNVAAGTQVLATNLGAVLGATEEGGLLGFAFHPQYATNGAAFVSYTVRVGGNAGLTQRLARVLRNGSGQLVKDIDLLERAVPAGSIREEHNIGGLAFGPDGNLYIGMGDAYVPGDDPLNPAQNVNSVFGKILRVTVGASGAYTIPDGNPYKGGGGAPEIYALGFRNPWRFSFDGQDLWVADVGDDSWEEVNKVQAGKNYGWSIMEATHCHVGPTCNQTGLTPPITEYPHGNGIKAVIGGFVYRGKKYPQLTGTYFYADFSGRVWSLPKGAPPAKVELETDLAIVSFAQDLDGELYILAYESMIQPAKIFQITGLPPPAPSTFPTALSLTGCFDKNNIANAVPVAVPYDINSPLWSDGADKRRWAAIPKGQKIHVRDDGDLEPPIGTTLIKEFRLQNKPVETRLFIRHTDGEWAGYSYEWKDDGTDAILLDADKSKFVGGQGWFYPSRGQCLGCHTYVANRSLGLEIGQLNKNFTYPDGKTQNQLAYLQEQSLLDKTLGDPATLTKFADPAGTDTVEKRARSYLHTNCSFCHRNGGTGLSPHDFLITTSFKDMKICNVVPTTDDLGVVGGRLFFPGDPAKSIISVRMKAVDGTRMPPLATTRVDTAATTLIDSWITATASCPP